MISLSLFFSDSISIPSEESFPLSYSGHVLKAIKLDKKVTFVFQKLLFLYKGTKFTLLHRFM